MYAFRRPPWSGWHGWCACGGYVRLTDGDPAPHPKRRRFLVFFWRTAYIVDCPFCGEDVEVARPIVLELQ